MGRPLVTIAIATYRSNLGYLSAAIESALGQTWREIEVVVADDSPDQSLRAVVEGFGDARIRYRHNSPPLGVARNHWSCFREARGDYIAVLNHDDLFAPTFLERLAAPLHENPAAALAFCDHWVIDEHGRRLNEQTDGLSAQWGRVRLAEGMHRPFYDLFAAQTIPMVMGTVFRRSLLPPVLPEQAGPAYDVWLAYLLCRDGLGAYYVPERLSSWRSHPANLTSQGRADWSQGTAECWEAVSRDKRLASVQNVAQRKAADAFFTCAVAERQSGRRAACAYYGWQSLRMLPTWKGLAACLLPVMPKRFATHKHRPHA